MVRVADELGFAARVRDVPDAPVLLFVHGLGCDVSFWDEAWTSPDVRGYSLLAVDLPGFGAAPPLRPFTIDTVVENLLPADAAVSAAGARALAKGRFDEWFAELEVERFVDAGPSIQVDEPPALQRVPRELGG